MRKISLLVLFCFMFTCMGLTGCNTTSTDTGDRDNIGQEVVIEESDNTTNSSIQVDEIKPENMIIDNSQLADKKIKLFVVDFINYLKDFDKVKELQEEDRFADLDNILISGGSIVIEGSLEEEVVIEVDTEVTETSDVVNVEVIETQTTEVDEKVEGTPVKEDVNPNSEVVKQDEKVEEPAKTVEAVVETVEAVVETAEESTKTEAVVEIAEESVKTETVEKIENPEVTEIVKEEEKLEEFSVEIEPKKETIQLAPFEDFFFYPAGSLITQEDINYIIPRMGVDMLPTYNFDEIYIDSVKVHETNERYDIVIKDSQNGEYKFTIVLAEDGDYRVDISDYFIREVSLKLATMGDIIVDGVEVSAPERNNLTQNTIYYFPAMTARVHKVDFNNTAYGPVSCEFVVDKSSYDVVTEVNYELSADETTKYLPIVKDLATNVITAMIKSQTVDSLKPYFVEGYNTDMLALYAEGAEIRLGTVGVPTITKVDFLKNTKSTLVGDNSIKVMFKYHISYISESYGKTPKTTSNTAFMTINTVDGINWRIEDIESSFLTDKYNPQINNWDKY